MGEMSPQAFVAKWKGVELKERSASQSHFNDLCAMLGVPDPISADPKGESYCFERGAKTADGDGWADVWKRGCFGWEYKGKKANLEAALKQLQMYALGLENPPLLIVSDMDRINIHTAFTGYATSTIELSLDDLLDGDRRDKLRWAFVDPERLRPGKTRQKLTEEAAKDFADLAQRLRAAGHPADQVAHFVNRVVFCMFAEDVGLLPDNLFTKVIEAAWSGRTAFEPVARQLFGVMTKGGLFGAESIDWFNGGLFNDDAAFPLDKDALALVRKAAALDWSAIDPSIFGTLFERGLDPSKRSQLGAHYTDREKIMLIVDPVIVRPLTKEWEAIHAQIAEKMTSAKARSGGQRTRLENEAKTLQTQFLERLKAFRVLDPACGSGNFLYLALLALKDLEHRVNIECEALGLPRPLVLGVGPENVRGIEINEFAAELARMSVWIGEIQWMRKNGFDAARNPVLKPLDHILCCDALLTKNGKARAWPAADAIIGNPPFLGGKLLLGNLGEEYVRLLRSAYKDRIPDFSDFVCFWFDKARAQIARGSTVRAGLVATNSIRGGANRVVLKKILRKMSIFDAWSDEPWVLEGAAVRVSIVCFGKPPSKALKLNGKSSPRINADLTSDAFDLTKAERLNESLSTCFEGGQKYGSFDVDGEVARKWLKLPSNVNGKRNSFVLKPYANAFDVVRRGEGRWIIDFGDQMSEHEAAQFEAPFSHVMQYVLPERKKSKTFSHRERWWLHGSLRSSLRSAIEPLGRYIVTPVVAKHRVFAWMPKAVWSTNLLDVIAREDDTTFGLLHSRHHELWSLRLGTSLEDRPRYTPTTTFETFPFPEGLTPNIPAADYASDPRAIAIAKAAKELNEKREAWLNPPEWVDRVPEVVPSYPDRIVAKPAHEAELKKRTLTNLYNERPTWLDNLHKALDAAVAAAYGWPADLNDEQILERLFALNQERAAAGR